MRLSGCGGEKSPAGQMDTMVWGCGQPHRQSAHTKENWY